MTEYFDWERIAQEVTKERDYIIDQAEHLALENVAEHYGIDPDTLDKMTEYYRAK